MGGRKIWLAVRVKKFSRAKMFSITLHSLLTRVLLKIEIKQLKSESGKSKSEVQVKKFSRAKLFSITLPDQSAQLVQMRIGK